MPIRWLPDPLDLRPAELGRWLGPEDPEPERIGARWAAGLADAITEQRQ